MTVTDTPPVRAQNAEPEVGSVFWAWIHGEEVKSAFMASVIAMFNSAVMPLIGSFFDLGSGPLLSLARNLCAEAFLESRQEWLWFVDSDTVFPPATLPRMLAMADPERAPIVSAAVAVVRGKPPYGQHGLPDLGWAAFNEEPDGTLGMISTQVQLDPLHRVDAVGTGCLLIHRSVLEAIGPGPFNEESSGKFVAGEDVAFCRRAAALGFPIHVAGHVRVGHAKVITLLCGTAISAAPGRSPPT